MLKIYKNCEKGGNGEYIIVTDETCVSDFEQRLGEALLVALDANPCDREFTIAGILAKAIPVFFKIAGYKADEVHETKQLICGHSTPSECTLIVEK